MIIFSPLTSIAFLTDPLPIGQIPTEFDLGGPEAEKTAPGSPPSVPQSLPGLNSQPTFLADATTP